MDTLLSISTAQDTLEILAISFFVYSIYWRWLGWNRAWYCPFGGGIESCRVWKRNVMTFLIVPRGGIDDFRFWVQRLIFGIYAFSPSSPYLSQYGGDCLGYDFCEEIPSPSWRSGVVHHMVTFARFALTRVWRGYCQRWQRPMILHWRITWMGMATWTKQKFLYQ